MPKLVDEIIINGETRPIYSYKNCKLRDPGGNQISSYNGFYFCRKRKRDGNFSTPERWTGITKEFYDIFKQFGSEVVDPNEHVIDYYNFFHKES